MSSNSACEIFNSRILNASLEKVYKAFSDPIHLKNWWGPDGFTNTIHLFDLRPGGEWILTMHGPEKGNYENSSVFKSVQPFQSISWTRTSQPYFDMEVGFNQVSETKTEITFRMSFKTAEECEKIKPYASPKNEENFDRLERELIRMED